MPKTTKQLAKQAGVSPRTIRRRIKAGTVRASKPGHDYIITGSSSGSAKKGTGKKGRKSSSKRTKSKGARRGKKR